MTSMIFGGETLNIAFAFIPMYNYQNQYFQCFSMADSLIKHSNFDELIYIFILRLIVTSYNYIEKKMIVDKLKNHQNLIIAAFIGFLGPKILKKCVIELKNYHNVHQQARRIYVGIELGGTNYNIALGHPQYDRNGKLINFVLTKQMDGRTSSDCEATLTEIVKKIQNSLQEKQKIYFVGISSFGPIELHKSATNYGCITSTPKQGWRNAQILKSIKKKLEVDRIEIETDVNAAAFAQFKLGSHQVKESLAYITVGTGVGVGVLTHQRTVHGLTHPEGGHIIIKRHPDEDKDFNGVCPYHQSCLQGMVANRSISKRTGKDYIRLNELEDSDKIWRIVGNYLAQLCLNITLTVSPQVIVIGGGIMNRKILLKYIHKDFLQLLSGYIEHRLFTVENIKDYIVAPKLGSQVGVKGALLLKYL